MQLFSSRSSALCAIIMATSSSNLFTGVAAQIATSVACTAEAAAMVTCTNALVTDADIAGAAACSDCVNNTVDETLDYESGDSCLVVESDVTDGCGKVNDCDCSTAGLCGDLTKTYAKCKMADIYVTNAQCGDFQCSAATALEKKETVAVAMMAMAVGSVAYAIGF